MTAPRACETGKVGAPSRAAILHLARTGRSKGARVRAYLCPFCHWWHTTTAPADPTARRRPKRNPR